MIDDDEMSLRSLEHILKEWMYHPYTFSAVGKKLFNEEWCDTLCSIVDYQLKYTDGLKIIAIMKRQYPDMRFILISGHELDNEILKKTEQMNIPFLAKPLNINSLKSVLNQIEKEKS